MAFVTNDAIKKFGTKDQVDASSSTVANNTYSVAADVDSTWANDEDADLGAAMIKCNFTGTMPTAGNIQLFARLLNVDGTNDMNVPDDNFQQIYCGTFAIDFGVSADVDFYSIIRSFEMPAFKSGQEIEWYIKNNGSLQTIDAAWNLWILPWGLGPKVQEVL